MCPSSTCLPPSPKDNHNESSLSSSHRQQEQHEHRTFHLDAHPPQNNDSDNSTTSQTPPTTKTTASRIVLTSATSTRRIEANSAEATMSHNEIENYQLQYNTVPDRRNHHGRHRGGRCGSPMTNDRGNITNDLSFTNDPLVTMTMKFMMITDDITNNIKNENAAESIMTNGTYPGLHLYEMAKAYYLMGHYSQALDITTQCLACQKSSLDKDGTIISSSSTSASLVAVGARGGDGGDVSARLGDGFRAGAWGKVGVAGGAIGAGVGARMVAGIREAFANGNYNRPDQQGKMRTIYKPTSSCANYENNSSRLSHASKENAAENSLQTNSTNNHIDESGTHVSANFKDTTNTTGFVSNAVSNCISKDTDENNCGIVLCKNNSSNFNDNKTLPIQTPPQTQTMTNNGLLGTRVIRNIGNILGANHMVRSLRTRVNNDNTVTSGENKHCGEIAVTHTDTHINSSQITIQTIRTTASSPYNSPNNIENTNNTFDATARANATKTATPQILSSFAARSNTFSAFRKSTSTINSINDNVILPSQALPPTLAQSKQERSSPKPHPMLANMASTMILYYPIHPCLVQTLLLRGIVLVDCSFSPNVAVDDDDDDDDEEACDMNEEEEESKGHGEYVSRHGRHNRRSGSRGGRRCNYNSKSDHLLLQQAIRHFEMAIEIQRRIIIASPLFSASSSFNSTSTSSSDSLLSSESSPTPPGSSELPLSSLREQSKETSQQERSHQAEGDNRGNCQKESLHKPSQQEQTEEKPNNDNNDEGTGEVNDENDQIMLNEPMISKEMKRNDETNQHTTQTNEETQIKANEEKDVIHWDLSILLMLLATMKAHLGHFDEAQSAYEESLSIRSVVRDSKKRWRKSMVRKINKQSRLDKCTKDGDYSTPEKNDAKTDNQNLMKRHLIPNEIISFETTSMEVAHTLFLLGRLHHCRRRYEDAFRYYNRALNLYNDRDMSELSKRQGDVIRKKIRKCMMNKAALEKLVSNYWDDPNGV